MNVMHRAGIFEAVMFAVGMICGLIGALISEVLFSLD